MSSKPATTAPNRVPQRMRLPLRFRRLRVLAVERLSAHFVRVILGGEDIEGFSSPGFDDHVKLFLPDAATGEIRLPEAGPDGPIWPEGPKPVARDYTPRHHDPEAGTLAIDFALHESGPATAWALQAKPGDELGVGGPRGTFLIPADFDWHLLAGDETAVPAIARRLEELPAAARAIVLVEIDRPGDELPLQSRAALEVHWCHRNGAAPGTASVLLEAMRRLVLPTGDGYAWVACETAAARALRQHLVQERGIDPKRVKAAGYWRRGTAGAHETIED